MAAQQQQQSGDNSMAPVWLTVLLFFGLWIAWKLAHEYVVSFVFQINIWEAKLVNLFLDNAQLKQDIFLMQTVDPATVDWNNLVDLTGNVGNYIRYPVIGILALMGVYLYRSNITHKFRKAHTMQTLRLQEQYNWNAIMPVVKEDLVSQDINEGPWAMAMTPMEFARKYDLLKKEDILLDNPLPGQEMTAGIRRGDAKRVFTLQLGPYWEGFEHVPSHAMALAAVFMSRINKDRDSATKILSHLNKTYAHGKIDYSIARPVLKKYVNTELVQEAIGSHAYLLTVMASLLEASREDGVVATAEFLWLKPVDRRLWYMLNCVGRQVAFSEVGGPFAHWLAEKSMGRRSLLPMIDEAITALEVAIKEVKLTPRQIMELKP